MGKKKKLITKKLTKEPTVSIWLPEDIADALEKPGAIARLRKFIEKSKSYEIKINEIEYHFKVIHEKRGFSAQCVEFQGCVTQGDTLKELHQNIKHALGIYLDESNV